MAKVAKKAAEKAKKRTTAKDLAAATHLPTEELSDGGQACLPALGRQVDQLGELRDRVHALKSKEQALTGIVTAALRAMRTRRLAASGKLYEAELIRKARLVVDDLPGLRRVAGRKFLKCVKTDIAAARRQLGDEVLRKLGEIQASHQLSVFKREPACQPRRSVAGRPGKAPRRANRT